MYDYRPYVSAAERRKRVASEIAKRTKKGIETQPVAIDGRAIARTFWGKAWCDHLENHCDYENRLPRGRTYVRNGSVVHLAVLPQRVDALVQGSELYKVTVTVSPLPKPRWKKIVGSCSGKIDSVVELLQGKLSSGVMTIVTDPGQGLFPEAAQIEMKCSCPDWATMCKHVAAVLYGVGARLDTKPELLFQLRGVDPMELLDGGRVAKADSPAGPSRRKRIAGGELSSVFGIELDVGSSGNSGKAKEPAAKARRSTAAAGSRRASR